MAPTASGGHCMTTRARPFARASTTSVDASTTVAPEQWAQPTPCMEWDVRQLVAHVVDEQLWIPALLAGESVAEVGDRFAGDQLRDAPDAAWRAAASGALDGGLRRRGTATQSAPVLRGRGRRHLPLADHRGHPHPHLGSGPRHGLRTRRWTGRHPPLSRSSLLRRSKAGGPLVRSPRQSAVPDDADPQTRLLALTGRRHDASTEGARRRAVRVGAPRRRDVPVRRADGACCR